MIRSSISRSSRSCRVGLCCSGDTYCTHPDILDRDRQCRRSPSVAGWRESGGSRAESSKPSTP